MVGAGGDVRRYAALGIAVAVALLNDGAAERVGVVARPDLREIAENAEVKAVAARSAALKENSGEAPGEFRHDLIQSADVAVRRFALPLGRQTGGIDVGKDAVHVPLDIIRARLGKDLAHFFDDKPHRFGIGQIENALVASLGMQPLRRGHRPVGMLRVELALDADHLRLDPDAELQTRGVDAFPQSFESVRQLLGIGVPVAEGVAVVVSLAEPAVVHDQHFNAQFLGGGGKPQQRMLGDIEITRLPTVEQHGTGLVFPLAADNMFTHKAVHMPTLSRKSLMGIGHDRLRRFKTLSRRQVIAEALRLNAADNAGFAKSADFHGGVMIAAVNQVEAVDTAPMLGRVGGMHHKEGIGTAGGTARAGFDDEFSGGQCGGVLVHLTRPRPVEGRDHHSGGRKVDLHTQQPFNGDMLHAAVVDKSGAAGDDVAFRVDAVMQLQREIAVFERHAEMLGFTVLGIGTGEGGKGRAGVAHDGSGKEEIRTAAAVFADNFDERFADIAVTARRHFEAHILQHGGGMVFGIGDHVAGFKFALLAEYVAHLGAVGVYERAVI